MTSSTVLQPLKWPNHSIKLFLWDKINGIIYFSVDSPPNMQVQQKRFNSVGKLFQRSYRQVFQKGNSGSHSTPRMKIMMVKAEAVHIHDSELNFKQVGTTPFLTRVCQFISQKCCFCPQDPEIPIMFSMQRTALLIFLFYSGLLPFVPLRESLLEIMLPVTMIR